MTTCHVTRDQRDNRDIVTSGQWSVVTHPLVSSVLALCCSACALLVFLDIG